MTAPASPQATRLQPPSWLDLRLVLGAALVAASVLGGTYLVTSATRTTKVWSVTSDLAGGTVLTDAHLRLVPARLPQNAGRYVEAGRSPVGRTLRRAVGSGELLPRAAIGPAPCGNRVSIPVVADHVPVTLAAGQRIDVYATAKSGDRDDPARVLTAVPVQAVEKRGSGWAVVVRIPEARTADVVRAIRTADLDIAVVDGSSGVADACAGGPAGSGGELRHGGKADEPDEQNSQQPGAGTGGGLVRPAVLR